MIIKDKIRLKQVCDKVTSIEEGEAIAVKLLEELNQSGSGVGLAANQIGINKRVCVVNVKEPIVFINPVITDLEGEVLYNESCLSFPKKQARTVRAKWVTVDSDNLGSVVFGSDDYDDSLLESVCVQHEIDHLDGITMFDRKFKLPQLKATKKFSRNEKVEISNGTETRILKWKKAEPMISNDNWNLSEVSV